MLRALGPQSGTSRRSEATIAATVGLPPGRRLIMAQGRSADKGPPAMPEIDCRALGSRRRTDHDARVCARPGVALRPPRGARRMIGRAALSGLLVAFAVSCGKSQDGSVPTLRSATIAAVIKGLDNPFFATMRDGLVATAGQHNARPRSDAPTGSP